MTFFKGKPFGLSITDTRIQAAQVKATPNHLVLVTIAEKELEPGIVVDGAILKEKELAEVVKVLLAEAKPHAIKQTDCVVTLPETQCFEHIFYLDPDLEGAKLKEAIDQQIIETIPVPYADIKYDYVIYSLEKTKVAFVAGVHREVIAQYYEVLQKFAKLKPISLEPKSISLIRNLRLEFTAGEGLILIDSQGDKINWYAFWGAWIFDSNTFSRKNSENVFDDLALDVQQSATVFTEKTGQPMGKIVLTGKPEERAALTTQLKEKLKIPIGESPAYKVDLTDLQEIGITEPANFSVVTGAALRGLDVKTKMPINLLKK